MKEKSIICMFKRAVLSKDEWDEIEDTVEESKITLKEMLEQWNKVMEGYHRVDERKKGK